MTVLSQRRRRTTTGATVAAAVVLLLTSGTVLAGSATPVNRPSGLPYPTDAPAQRYGTAAGEAHLVGGERNTVVPPSLRSRYPLASASTATPTPKGRNTAIVAAAPQTEATGFDPASSREAAGERDAHTRVWRNADGTDTTEIGTRPLNYRSADGSWQPIDSRLVPGAGGWRTAADEVELRLPSVADGQRLATVALPGAAAVEFGLRDAARVTGRTDGAAVVYPGIRPLTDVRLEGVPGGVKETLVLHDASAPTVFTYPLRLTGLRARMDGGGVAFVDGAGVPRATIPAGVMADSAAEPATSTGVRYRLVDDGTALEVALDPSWLRDPARRYPVLVDPSVETGAADASMVVRGGSSVSGGSELQVGSVGGASTASYLRFDGLASRLRNHKIFGAQLQVLNFDAASCRPRAVTVHPVTQSWSPATSFAFPGPAVGARPGHLVLRVRLHRHRTVHIGLPEPPGAVRPRGRRPRPGPGLGGRAAEQRPLAAGVDHRSRRGKAVRRHVDRQPAQALRDPQRRTTRRTRSRTRCRTRPSCRTRPAR